MENKKELFVVRPSKSLKIRRIEKNIDKLQEMYELGVNDCIQNMHKIRNFLEN